MPQKYFKVTGKCDRCPALATSQVEARGYRTEKLCVRCVDRWWADWHQAFTERAAQVAVA